MWGIGFRHSERLKNNKVNTAHDFILLPDNWVRKKMSVVGLRLKKELEGKSVLDLEEITFNNFKLNEDNSLRYLNKSIELLKSQKQNKSLSNKIEGLKILLME